MIIALALLFVGGGLWLFSRLGGGQAQGPIPTATRPPPAPTTAPAVAPKATEAPKAVAPTTPTQAPAGKVTSAVTANAQLAPRVQSFDGVEMALVPPGCFMMGTADPPTGGEDEKPATRICIEQPFWIDKTEVTQAQFKRLGGKAANSPWFPGDNRPVERITWFEARDFCAKRGARLPTEAEWEYAARGPDGLIYPWGNTFDKDKAVYSENSGNKTADVGSRPTGASWVGALDMSGNVWEWVSSLYQPYPYRADDGRENPEGQGPRALRGGSWICIEFDLRAAFRFSDIPAFVSFVSGFRCARSS